MSQHDMSIANQGFPSFRSDLNDALAALVSNSSGASAPSATFANQFWVDTSADPSVLKIRNVDNDAWIALGTIDQTNDRYSLTPYDVSIANDLTFTGTGNRITGDFSNATVANRVMFQSSTTNGNTVVGALPNGTATVSTFNAYNSSDTVNNAYIQLAALSTEARVGSTITGTGTYMPMTFHTGGSERMRIDTSGNVGIGGTPFAYGAGYTDLWVQASTTPVFDLAVSTTRTATFYTSSTEANFGTVSSIPLIFQTANTERARIDSSGNLLVGTTSKTNAANGVILSPTESYFTATDTYVALFNRRGTDGSVLLFQNDQSNVGSISVSGTATSYNTSSDYRLKENIAPMTGALSVVQALKPCTYTWKADGSAGEGFIAHELAEVVPQCVTGEKDAVDADGNPIYQGIDTSFLVATLTAAIQELKTLNDAQASTITQLTERISALEGKA